MSQLIEWFRLHEWVAIWLEGIALVAIFFWDRLDSRADHQRMMAQMKISRDQVKASQDQVEASHKPFVMFSTEPRRAEEEVLEFGSIVGGMLIWCPGGSAELGNVGSGPAVNIRYTATPTNPDSTIARPSGYLVGMLPGNLFLTPIPRGILEGNEWEIVIDYESLSGRKYKTTTLVNDLVLTNIKFEAVSN
jgi:hypothetical protein